MGTDEQELAYVWRRVEEELALADGSQNLSAAAAHRALAAAYAKRAEALRLSSRVVFITPVLAPAPSRPPAPPASRGTEVPAPLAMRGRQTY